ncbi:hypothetical protein GCM10023238_28870 [Streptomyces heliomycini]
MRKRSPPSPPRAAGGRTAFADRVLDAAHNPAGARAVAAAIGEAFQFSRLIGVVGASGDKNVRGLLEAFEPVSPRSSSPGTPATARWTPTSWRRSPIEVFGEDRVPGRAAAAGRPGGGDHAGRGGGEFAGGGVLVTGSVITVGEADCSWGRG